MSSPQKTQTPTLNQLLSQSPATSSHSGSGRMPAAVAPEAAGNFHPGPNEQYWTKPPCSPASRPFPPNCAQPDPNHMKMGYYRNDVTRPPQFMPSGGTNGFESGTGYPMQLNNNNDVNSQANRATPPLRVAGRPHSPQSELRSSPISPAPVSLYNQQGSMNFPAGNGIRPQPKTQMENVHGPVPPGMFINQPNSFGNRMIPGPSMPMGYPQNAYPNVPPVPMDRNSGYVGNGVPGDYKPQPGFINNAPHSNGPVTNNSSMISMYSGGENSQDSVESGGHSESGPALFKQNSGANPLSVNTPSRGKANGLSKEGLSHPSTPAGMSPGASSTHEDESSLSSPSWPRTPLSPSSSVQRAPSTLSASSTNAPTPSASHSKEGSGNSTKETGQSLVLRLLGDINVIGCSPQEYAERRRFYESLVQFCETHGSPITAQPTVSKQTVDLYRLYMAVKQRGGFEEACKKKVWRDLCLVFGIGQSNSASGQLKKQYAKTIFPFECCFDKGGVDPQPILTSLESKKKNKSKAHGGAVASGGNQSFSSDSSGMMGPPNGPFQQQPQNGPADAPPAQPFPPGYQPAPNSFANGPRMMAPTGSGGGPAVSEMVRDPFDDRPRPFPTPTTGYPPQSSGPQYQPRPPNIYYGNQFGGNSNPPPSDQFGQQPPHRPFQPQQPQSELPSNAGYNPQTAQTPPYSGQTPTPTPMERFGPGSSEVPANIPPPNQYTRPLYNGPQPTPGFATATQSPVVRPPPQTYPAPNTGYPSVNGPSEQQDYQMRPNCGGMENVPQPGGYVNPPAPYMATGDTRMMSGPSGPPAMSIAESPGTQFPGWSQAPQAKTPTSSKGSGAVGGGQYPPRSLRDRQMVIGAPLIPNPDGSGPHMPGVYMNPSVVTAQSAVIPKEIHKGSVPQTGPGQLNVALQQRREIFSPQVFPRGCVEATQCDMMSRKKKIGQKDIGSGTVDAWKLVMSLKSGLAAEINWALNVLSVLLYDESAVVYFGLAHMPGLLEALVELFNDCLAQVFGDEYFPVVELASGSHPGEVNQGDSVEVAEMKIFPATFLKRPELPSTTGAEGAAVAPVPLKKQKNYTMVTRAGRSVKLHGSHDMSKLNSLKLPGVDDNCVANLIDIGATGLWRDKEILKHRVPKNGYTTATVDYLCSATEHLLKSIGGGEEKATKSLKRTASITDLRYTKKICLAGDEVENAEKMDSGHSRPTFFYRSQPPSVSDEVVSHNQPPVSTVSDSEVTAMDRCRCVSGIIRGLSFVPSNDAVVAKQEKLLELLGKILLLHHSHLPTKLQQSGDNSTMEIDSKEKDVSADELQTKDPLGKRAERTVDLSEPDWWWDCLNWLRDDSFVVLCNVSSNVDLIQFEEVACRSISDALLHWASCSSPYAHDPLPVACCILSPFRYSLEIMCKLSVQEHNVDLLLATTPWDRIESVVTTLSNMLGPNEETPLREFAIVLLSSFAMASEVAAVHMAQQSIIQSLVVFLEMADSNMHQVVQNSGMNALRENPELMGTSVGMLRRAAHTLLYMARVAVNRVRFARHQPRLLQFTMSQLMDSRVASTIADVLYELQKSPVACQPSVASDLQTAEVASTPAESQINEAEEPVEETDSDELNCNKDRVADVEGSEEMLLSGATDDTIKKELIFNDCESYDAAPAAPVFGEGETREVASPERPDTYGDESNTGTSGVEPSHFEPSGPLPTDTEEMEAGGHQSPPLTDVKLELSR